MFFLAGYEVVEAKDGVDALGKCNAPKVDLFITDLNMPNMDGIPREQIHRHEEDQFASFGTTCSL